MAEITILTLGDIHGRIGWTDTLRSAARDCRMVLLCGDLTDFGGPDEARRVIEEITAYCPQVYAVPGNCDSPEILPWLSEAGISLHGRGIEVEPGLGLCGVGGSNHTPFATPLELDPDELAYCLERGWTSIAALAVRIVLHHAPPYRTRCDRTRLGLHVGVKGLRAFCEAREPELVVCGHIHEARGIDRIGATVVVNGGMAARGHGALVSIRDRVVEVELL